MAVPISSSVESQPPAGSSSSRPHAQSIETAPTPHPPPSTKNTKCKCQCNPECDCDCPCLDHCVCIRGQTHQCEQTLVCEHVCKNQCGSLLKSCRNLVVCIDGTMNQFGHWNTNVVELHNRILKGSKDANQLTFYSSGIGTYVPPTTHRLSTWFYNMIDSAIARNFMKIIGKAYRWLADHYQDGDRIFLFGFSRGAYQVRALAGMIQKLGLVFSGNTGLIPFAYELYAKRHRGEDIKDEADARALAENFKRTFSREVKAHFVGVWDTVASIGFIKGSPLPLTTTAYHICTFRHGLALDEHRVKFLPTYLAGGWNPNLELDEYYNPDDKRTNIKEVWFVGSHSDVGGSNDPRTLNLGLVPLLWMETEAIDAGLRFGPRTKLFGDWTWDHIHKSRPTISLSYFWLLLEILPIKRYRYTDRNATTRMPHLGKGRSIVPRQYIHVSVAFSREKYKSKATFFGDKTTNMESIISIHINSDKFGDLSWADEWKHTLEMNLFDDAFAQGMITRLNSLASGEPGTRNDSEIAIKEGVCLLWRLSIMALSYRSAKQISSEIGSLVKMLDKGHNIRIQAASAFCLFQLTKHGFSGQIASEENALRELERMLKSNDPNLRIASLQCLSQLVLDSESCNGNPQQGTNLGRATEILNEQAIWPEYLYDYLVDSDDHSIQHASLSCLLRLAKSVDMRRKFMECIDKSEHAKRSILVTKLLEYLKQPQSGFHAALALGSMSTSLINQRSVRALSLPQTNDLFDGLISGIRNGNPMAKGAYMQCLSEYFQEDDKFRRIALQTNNFIGTLIAELFGTKRHCSMTQKKFAMQALLIIVGTKLKALPYVTPESREIIQMVLQAICVEFWLSERDGSMLLLGILSNDSLLPLRLDRTEGSFKAEEFPEFRIAHPGMKLVAELIISEMVQLTQSTRPRRPNDLGHTLYRVQAYLNVLHDYDVLRPLIYEHGAIDTIITGMMHRISREKAVEFLESLAGRTDGVYATEHGRHFMPLLIDITELGRKITRNDKDKLAAIFKRDGIRNNGEGARPLANVRDALRALVPYNNLRKYILEPSNFEIIKKTIDLQDTIQTHRGDRVEAEIARVKCLQALMVYPDARKMMNSDLLRPLLHVHQAFNEELGSSQWLNMWPEYDKLLEETSKKFMENVDADHFGTLAEDVQERLGRFGQRPQHQPIVTASGEQSVTEHNRTSDKSRVRWVQWLKQNASPHDQESDEVVLHRTRRNSVRDLRAGLGESIVFSF
ncbi:hypothetical protein EDD85DRAFT_916368 [Armillaria nabsnona]|nr:hypothetical protein EDD85DRAFT_916368 [Armillaria nabsnona]